MQRKFTQLCYVVMLFLSIKLSLSLSVVAATEAKPDLTPVLTEYLEKLRINCEFGVSEFAAMHDALTLPQPQLINPMSEEQSLLSMVCRPYWQNLEKIVAKVQPDKKAYHTIDWVQLRHKVDHLITEIKNNAEQREEAQVRTTKINREMEFVPLPSGSYPNKYLGAITIEPEVAIQTTPVTQYQWVKVMGENPAYFKTGEDACQVELDGKRHEMCPNKPVESISYEDITKFIARLNAQDENYDYQLPSIAEYLVVQSDKAKPNGSYCLSREATCHVEFSSYQNLGDERIYAVADNVREFTRDSLARSDLPATNKILFGLPYNFTPAKTDALSAITAPIYYVTTLGKDIGFRLVRYKKSGFISISKNYDLTWDEKTVDLNENYIWDKECQIYIYNTEHLDWMVENRERYSKEVQHTLDVILEKATVKKLKNKLRLYLEHQNISDVTPLAGLVNLNTLYLNKNKISDITPLVNLVKLKDLDLSDNEILDITSLARLTNLVRLQLMNNKISDITPLAGLLKLNELNLNGNSISDITYLTSLLNLKFLSLYKNKISDITPLIGLVNLTDLLLHNNKILDITPMAGLVNLELLVLYSNEILDITPVGNLINLSQLLLNNNRVSDIMSLASLAKLSRLDLSENNITDITSLTGLEKLKKLDVIKNPILNYSPLEELGKKGCKISK